MAKIFRKGYIKIFTLFLVLFPLISFFVLKSNIIEVNGEESEEQVYETFKTSDGYDVTKVLNSGSPDEESIVIVFLAEGFTKDEQDVYLDKVVQFTEYIKNVKPFSYFYDYITIYATHTISNESGVSGEDGKGKFTCSDSNGNPTTNLCTPTNSVFNCEHGRDTIFKAFHLWSTAEKRVLLHTTDASDNLARKIAKSVSSSVKSVQILANSSIDGGAATISTSNDFLGVALTSINNLSDRGYWYGVIKHEIGHSLGGLGEEYWSYNLRESVPNNTRNSDPNTVKWSHLIGYEGIGVYQYEGNPNHNANPWYKPSQICAMYTNDFDFCLVCEEQIINRIQYIIGVKLYDTTVLDDGTIRIDKVNVNLPKEFRIHPVVNERVVTQIGDNAFENQSEVINLTIPDAVTSIGDYAFKNCSSLKKITKGNNIVRYGKGTFENCISLETYDFIRSDVIIDESIFKGCMALKEVKLFCNEKMNFTEPNFTFIDCNPNVYRNLGQPSNLKIDGNMLTWDPVSTSKCYEVQLYNKNEKIGEPIYVTSNELNISNIDITQYEAFNFTVKAKSDGLIDSIVGSSMPRVLVCFRKKFSNGEIIFSDYYLVGYQIPMLKKDILPGYIFENWKYTYKLFAGGSIWVADAIWNFDEDVLEKEMNFFSKAIECPHKYDGLCDSICNDCGFVRENVHNFVERYNDNEHWYECSNCGVEKENTRYKHSAEGDPLNCETLLICSCGYVIKENTEHNYDCKCDLTCNICGYIRELSADTYIGNSDYEKKWLECIECGTEKEGTCEYLFINKDNEPSGDLTNCNVSSSIIKILLLIDSCFILIFTYKKRIFK